MRAGVSLAWSVWATELCSITRPCIFASMGGGIAQAVGRIQPQVSLQRSLELDFGRSELDFGRS